MQNKNKKKIFFSLFLILLMVYIWYNAARGGFFHYVFDTNIEDLVDYIDSFGKIGPIILFFFIIVEVIAAPIPGFILYIVAGVILGSFYGGLLSFIGNMIGSIIAFQIAWKGRIFFFKNAKSKVIERFDSYSEKYGGYAIFLLRLNPFTSSDIFSYLAGFSKMKLKQFIIGTALGLLPITFLSSYLGGEIIKGHPTLYTFFLFLSLIYLMGAIYLIYITRVLTKFQEFERKVKEKIIKKIKK